LNVNVNMTYANRSSGTWFIS